MVSPRLGRATAINYTLGPMPHQARMGAKHHLAMLSYVRWLPIYEVEKPYEIVSDTVSDLNNFARPTCSTR